MGNHIDPVLAEARRLYKLGFAIHWLRPKSKIPVEAGWTKGARKSWKDLHETYKPGYNVGVRLGKASVIAGSFLTVIDVDVKSSEGRHRVESLEAAREITGGIVLPMVRSGRGGGSRHYYALTKEPFKTHKVAASTELVKVHMPSAGPASKRDLEKLTSHEIDRGYRIRPAWEIGLMSEGSQVVLPPSIHPDSGEAYRWKRPIGSAPEIPVLSIRTALPGKPEKTVSPVITVLEDFEVEPVEWQWLDISDGMRQAIVTGDSVTDDSAFLMKAYRSLRNAGLTQNEVLTVLTDPTNYLGACAYRHAGNTTSRKRAAEWLYRFTAIKVEPQIFEKADVNDFRNAPLPPEDEPKGFYEVGPKGKLLPLYNDLLLKFEEDHPYRSIADMKAVYVFNGTHYEDITPIEIRAFAETYFSPKPEAKIRNEFLDKVLVNNVKRRRFFIDTTEGKINFKNGILDLNGKNELLSHDSHIGFRGVLPFDYIPDARCPLFLSWLDGVMLGDEALIAVLQEFMGYIVRAGEYRYHKALWLEGTGRNGKSTFIDVLKALIGPTNYSTLSIKALINDKFAGSDLDGKIANFSEETSPQELADSGPFKNLTGDGDMSAQKKFGDIYSFRNRAKLVMSYNTIPDLKDLSPGMLSRPLIVPFRKNIKESEQDHDIKKKLFEELPGIFNFALEGWHRLEAQNHFTASVKSQQALRKIKTESCNVYQFVENYIRFSESDGRIIPSIEIYTAYKGRERYAYSYNHFCKRLVAHAEMEKRGSHTRDGKVYTGIKII